MAKIQDTTAGKRPDHVGADLRALRKSRGVTLAAIAEHLGRSNGWLSQVERGQTEPGISDLRQIAEMFEIPISFFFRNEQADRRERGTIVRADLRASLGSRREGLVEELLSPNLSGDFEMVLSKFEAGATSEWIAARPTYEGGYLIKGQLKLWIGDTPHELEAGDSFQFQNEKYRWKNTGTETAEAVWVIAPPIY